MKRKISLLSLILLSSVLLFSCSDREKKADKVYIDWYGYRFELTDTNVVKSIYNSWAMVCGDYNIPFDSYIEFEKEDETPFVVIRAECTGDLRSRIICGSYEEDPKKAAEKERHYNQHTVDSTYDSMTDAGFFIEYVDAPFKVLEILEGDQTLLEVGEEVYPEMFDVSLGHPNIGKSHFRWADIDDPKIDHNFLFQAPGGYGFVLPRIGYEYILLLRYSPDTDCFNVRMDVASCELSTPEEYIDFLKSYATGNELIYLEDDDIPIEEKMPQSYYEILDRYNITVE